MRHFYICAVDIVADCLFRLQEAILTTPRGITRLMDMLMDREVRFNYILYICNVVVGLCKSLYIYPSANSYRRLWDDEYHISYA